MHGARSLESSTRAANGAAIEQAAVLVARVNGGRHLIAAERIEAGTSILELDGIVLDTPDRYSVQVGVNAHLRPPADAADNDDAYLWRYLNHACTPNAAFFGRRLVAMTTIRAGEEISFDYNTTEWDMSSPFRCSCGRCDGREVRGYRHLSEAERARLEPHVAEHLRQRGSQRERQPT